MPLSSSFEKHRLVEGIRELRKRPAATYAITILAVAVATALRLSIGGELMAGLPFITYYPAIIIAALIGGFGCGVLAIVLSVLAAWFLFLPPMGSWELEYHAAISLAVFVVMGLVNVAIVHFLDAAISHAMAQEQNVRSLIQSAPNGILVVDDGGRITLINASIERLFGYKQEELLGRQVDLLVGEKSAPKHHLLRESYVARPEERPMGQGRDLSARRKDGSEFPVEIGLNPIKNTEKSGVLATVIDITERVRAHEAQKLIIHELHHRTQNLFAVMEAIIGRSFDETKTPAEARYTLRGRVHALAQAYATVTNAAGNRASLRDFLSDQLAPFSERVSLSGCDLFVSPSATQQFALIAHELATNALKYGALSTPEGRVSVEGKVERINGTGQLLFVWKETGGPPPAEPSRKGFGSVILMDVAKQWAGDVSADFSSDGLTYSLRVPLEVIEIALSKEVGLGPSGAIGIQAPGRGQPATTFRP
jgi:PAS domain S-box-containing protein